MIPRHGRERHQLEIRDADLHNLKKVSVDIPVGVMTVVTGVAGSGKSTLVAEVFMGRSPRGDLRGPGRDRRVVALHDSHLPRPDGPDPTAVREGQRRGRGPVQLNSTGACEECQGRGVIITELAYMGPVTTHCESCDGRRFTESVLAHRLRGQSIADVLEMPAEQAVEFFTEPALAGKLRTLVEVGLGYLTLGQPLSTLSGGERQTPETGDRAAPDKQRLHTRRAHHRTAMSDVATLLALLNRLVDNGNTVVVVEHNLDVIQQADWIIDLGPDGGRVGGEIVFTGTPHELLSRDDSRTGQYLRRHRQPAGAV